MSSRASNISLSASKMLYFLIAFRICNALLLQTFFQPDEYFQSLEPAWNIAFGSESGAWITWEWRQRLRSSLHPVFFAAVYRIADFIAHSLGLGSSARSQLLVSAPKVVQAVFAALTDYYTVQLARKAYRTPKPSYGALLLTILSPWQFFCSTRTLSNSLETTLTAVALYFWPFEASLHARGEVLRRQQKQMGIAFAFAALATILRPTNVLIWLAIALYTALSASSFQIIDTVKALLLEAKAAIVSGLAVFALSVISDRLYYDEWTFPPLRFIHFNVVQSLAVFYGRNRPDYYTTEGLPLLLTTSLPFAAWGLYKAVTGRSIGVTPVLRPLALSVLLFTTLMSVIAHKEVRFIYPLLPALNVLAAEPFAHFFSPPNHPWPRTPLIRRTGLAVLLAVNLALALYISRVHQRGVIDVLHFLRSEHEHAQHQQRGSSVSAQSVNTTVSFLMPCHSTPWRSHLVHSGIHARALTCEPPIDVPLADRGSYLDEADQFYADPPRWMRENMQPVPTTKGRTASAAAGDVDADVVVADAASGAWPEYLVFFEQLEPTMREFLQGSAYEACWRGFNTHWHDDWRRHGDVVVWRLQ